MLYLGMKIQDIEINDTVTFTYGDNLQFFDTGKVYHIEDNCDVEGGRILHIEVEGTQEVYEVIESELGGYWHRP